MIDVYLHGFGSSGARFRQMWEAMRMPPDGSLFPDGDQPEPLTGERRWFPLSGTPEVLAGHVAAAADRLTPRLARHLKVAGAERLRLFGHSQGGMLALELVRRGTLPVAFCEVFASCLPTASAAREWHGRPGRIVLNASEEDRYVMPGDVRRTAQAIEASGIPVCLRWRGAGHAFTPAWFVKPEAA